MYELLSIAAIIITLTLLWLLRRAFKAVAAARRTDLGRTSLNYLEGLNHLFCERYHRLQYTPIDLPAQGPALVAANHLSGLDGFLLVAASPRPIRFLIAREQYERFGATWLFRAIGCIPIDRSSQTEFALRSAVRALEAGEVIALFPQGGMVLPGKTRKIKRGIFWLAQRTNCPIYPVTISGIASAGHVTQSLLWRSHAKIVNYPPLNWNKENSLEYLQDLLSANGKK